MSAGLLNLAVGSALEMHGMRWVVDQLEPQHSRVMLTSENGLRERTNIRYLLTHAGFGPEPEAAGSPAQGSRQPAVLDDLTPHQQDLVALRMAHLLEVETGFRGGDPTRPDPGEPKSAYDPAATTLTQRRHAKVAELRALDREHARLLALNKVGYRTLIRWEVRKRRLGALGCADGRWLRPGGGHPSVSDLVLEAIYEVRQESLRRSRMSMASREVLLRQLVLEKHGPQIPVPSRETLRLVWKELFGHGGARQRYAASSHKPSGQHVIVHRPGQVVVLDTTILPVKVLDGVFGEPVSVHLTTGLDAYTHSAVAFRLTLVSDSSIDVAMLLRDMMMPLPLREDWGEELEWPYPGLPSAVVAEFAGHKVAALPFFTPETVTTDHGSVYRNHHLVEVQRVIGTNILPSRVLRPTDKQAIERAFGAFRSLLFERLLGYTGVDVADRGSDPEEDAVLTIEQMEHKIATWIVKVWQNRKLGGHAPAWGPGEEHSPNSLMAVAMGQGGFAMQIPAPELFFELLPITYVRRIDPGRGVKVRGLFYDDPALDDFRNQPSARGGRHKRGWVIRRDPRDRRYTFFQDPRTEEWHTLRWTGLPPEGEVPCFGDARVTELLREAKRAGLAPRSDAELLPVLLELIGGLIPAASWPTQMPKKKRAEHAREALQGQAAAADRPPAAAATGQERPVPAENIVTALPSAQRPVQAVQAVDAERRRRREATTAEQPNLPARLGDSYRRGNLFLLPAADETDNPEGDEHGPA
ncbi:transposase [Nonomuraea sp. NPDC003707]